MEPDSVVCPEHERVLRARRAAWTEWLMRLDWSHGVTVTWREPVTVARAVRDVTEWLAAWPSVGAAIGLPHAADGLHGHAYVMIAGVRRIPITRVALERRWCWGSATDVPYNIYRGAHRRAAIQHLFRQAETIETIGTLPASASGAPRRPRDV